jgi:hypothetical protein
MKYILEIEKTNETVCCECPCLHIIGEEGYTPCVCEALNREIKKDYYGIPKTPADCPLKETLKSKFVWMAWENTHMDIALVGLYYDYKSAVEATKGLKDVLIEQKEVL